MAFPTIEKQSNSLVLPPNLSAEGRVCDAPESRPDGLPGGGINIAYEALDRHLLRGGGDKTALVWLAKTGEERRFSYRDLTEQSSRFAAVLSELGVEHGEHIFGLAGRVPELYIALLGTLRFGCVFSPLFSAFGPEPVRARMEIGDARVLVTTGRFYRKKVMPWRDQMPGLKVVLLIDPDGDLPPGCFDLKQLLNTAETDFPCVSTTANTPALLHFTSGTTGKPKGAVHVHGAVEHHIRSAFFALDLHAEDIYWCTADPGWVTGTSYGVIAPLCLGVTMVVDEAEFEARHWYQVLQAQRVSVWYTAPTAVRMLMKAGDELPGEFNLSHLRFISSVGEPLNPEAVVWSQRVLGLPFHDNWWQTETGGIMIANLASMPVKPGSMGKPLPGITAAIVQREPDGTVVVVTVPGVTGELALKRGWPSMFRAYLNQPQRYDDSFSDDWYLSGDLASCDADGYFWFVGRSDDVIKTAGHLIGPFEVESILIEHPAVAEAAVIGKPDPVAGEIIKAFVALHPGYAADDALLKSLQAHARRHLGAAVAPKEIDFRDNLPKTRSGKIMRRLLKARELGLPEGDISTLESDER
jgi:acetyl-CoA synthetase